MIRLGALFLLASLTSASAQQVFESLAGQYGSATDPATSCATNPHELSFELPGGHPHANFVWTEAWTDAEGRWVSHNRYDMLGYDDSTLTLRLEGDRQRTADGARPTWILRMTRQPEGYCWGRTDWPVVRCEDHQLRCESATS